MLANATMIYLRCTASRLCYANPNYHIQAAKSYNLRRIGSIGRIHHPPQLVLGVAQPTKPFILSPHRGEVVSSSIYFIHRESQVRSYLRTILWPSPKPSFIVMAEPSHEESSAPESGVFRTADAIELRILDLKDGEEIVRQALEDPKSAKLIRSIVIVASEVEEEEEDSDEDIDIQQLEDVTSALESGADPTQLINDDDDAASIRSEENEDSDDKTAKLKAEAERNEALNVSCKPIIQVLDAIHAANGSLTSFSWVNPPGWEAPNGQRYQTFWTALWKHAPKLEKLAISFNVHELHDVVGPTEKFPVLHELSIDATTAHGDNGAAVEDLLKRCPAVETLEFAWPGCDLDNCQIQNISWNYTFPKLRSLTLEGYDFAPAALATFLEQHPSVEDFFDGVDGEQYDSYTEATNPRLAPTCLPNVKIVNRASSSARYPEDWFSDEAGRKIAHLCLPWGSRGYFEVSKAAAAELKCLEINTSNVTDWRPKEADSDDDEETKKKIEQDPEKELVKNLRGLLSKLTSLKELGIRLESGSMSIRLPDMTWGSPPGMDENDLAVVLSVLPQSGSIRALRVWDTKGKPLPQGLLNNFPNIPKSLEYLGWEGEEKVLYQFVRSNDGKVKALSCAPIRKVDQELKGRWDQKRILDY